nr:phosphoserine phosphatase SerB [Sediminivirga luteola]
MTAAGTYDRGVTTRISLLSPALPPAAELCPGASFTVTRGPGFDLATALVPSAQADAVLSSLTSLRPGPAVTDVLAVPGTLCPPRLVLMDVDSTLINEEVIEVLAGYVGKRRQVAEITDRAMAGELDFAASLRERVALLAGVPGRALQEASGLVSFTPGVPEFVAAVQADGGTVALVSGGFAEVVEPLVRPLGITRVRANRLEVSAGTLTGRLSGELVGPGTKAEELRRLAAELGVPVERTVAIGDGANDIEMIAQAGFGIAFCAKPALAARADAQVRLRRMDAVYAALTGRIPAAEGLAAGA